MSIELAAVELLKLRYQKKGKKIKNIKKKYKKCFYFLATTSMEIEEFLDYEEIPSEEASL